MQDIRTQLQQSQARATTGTSGRRPLSASVNGSVPSSPFDSENIPLRPEDEEALQTGSSQVTSGSEPGPTAPLTLYPNTGIVGRKRRGAPEEADAVVRRISCRTNLSQSIQESLSLYAEATAFEREIMAHCAVLRLHERLDHIQPVDAPYTLTNGSELKTQLEKYKGVVMTSQHTPSYVGDPARLVIEILSKHGLAFGLTQAIAESPSKLRVIAAYARTRCSDLRKDFKKHIKGSLGSPSSSEDSEKTQKRDNALDIERLVKKCIGNNKPYIIITAEMCARFAYLRFIYTKTEGVQLWQAVDKGLETIRNECPVSEPGGKEAQSRFFVSILEKDLALYGFPTNSKALKTYAESDIQREVLDASLATPTIDIGPDNEFDDDEVIGAENE